MNKPSLDDLKHAATIAAGFMQLGQQAIDRKYGEGYTERNPALLVAFMQAAALAYSTSKHTEEPNHEQP